MLVTLVGRDILRGRTLTERIEGSDYDHVIVACLLHDIGYVRGILKGDTKTSRLIQSD
jgi:predicted HD phosphohydrolase